MERQNHGFKYQELICEKHKLRPDEEYTGLWDAYNENNIPCVVKTFKEASELPLSDIFNNASRNRDFILYYGIWSGKKTNIISNHVVHVDIEKWRQLFEFNEYDELKDWIKNKVSNSRSYDSIWKEECKVWKEKWGKDRLVQPRFKRDHKKQRRIQSGVSFTNIPAFLEYISK